MKYYGYIDRDWKAILTSFKNLIVEFSGTVPDTFEKHIKGLPVLWADVHPEIQEVLAGFGISWVVALEEQKTHLGWDITVEVFDEPDVEYIPLTKPEFMQHARQCMLKKLNKLPNDDK